jgi:hypothetical protein
LINFIIISSNSFQCLSFKLLCWTSCLKTDTSFCLQLTQNTIQYIQYQTEHCHFLRFVQPTFSVKFLARARHFCTTNYSFIDLTSSECNAKNETNVFLRWNSTNLSLIHFCFQRWEETESIKRSWKAFLSF